MSCARCKKIVKTIYKKASSISEKVLTDPMLTKNRLDHCRQCSKSFKTVGRIRCGECLCFMDLKAALAFMHCPLGKW